jgi:hypothetical protein
MTKKTVGGFLEDDSDRESPSRSESDEDALFYSAPKEYTSGRPRLLAKKQPCAKHRQRHRRCPSNCPNLVNQPNSTSLLDSPETSSPSTASVRLVKPSKASKPASAIARSKLNQALGYQSVGQKEQIAALPTTGGKSVEEARRPTTRPTTGEQSIGEAQTVIARPPSGGRLIGEANPASRSTSGEESIREAQTVATRPTTGGKTFNPEAMAAYLESLNELGVSDDDTASASASASEAEAEAEAEVEDPIHARKARQPSPITEKDVYHWSYKVQRKTWHPWTDEDAAEWIICGKASYTSLQQANAMADKETTIQRDGHSLQPSTAEWTRKFDEHGMVHIYLDCTNNIKEPGFVKIRVHRELRTMKNGILPRTKFGWLNTIVWEIRKTTTTTTFSTPPPPQAQDDIDALFESPAPQTKNELPTQTTTTTSTLPTIYTNIDEANRRAADLTLDVLVIKPASSRLEAHVEYQKQRQEESKELLELCDSLEQEDGDAGFEAEVEPEAGVSVKIEVVGRALRGPRNI